LTLQDLGEEEKAKVQRLVEKLVGLSREHEEVVSALSTERARHAEEIDTANRRLDDELYAHESKLREQSASMVSLQEQRSEALRLLRVYQARIEQMHQALMEQQDKQLHVSKELEARKDTCSRVPLLEASVVQLEQLVDSQKKSIESLESTGKNSSESHKAQLLLLEKRYQEALEQVANQKEMASKANTRCLGLETACSGLTKQITLLNKGSKEKDEQICELQAALQKFKESLETTPTQPLSSPSLEPFPAVIPAPAAPSSSSSSSSYNGGVETMDYASDEARGSAAVRSSSLPSPPSSTDIISPARNKGQMRSGLNEVHQEVLRQQIQHQKHATQVHHEKNILRHTKFSSPTSPPHLHLSRRGDEHVVEEERNEIQKKKKKHVKRIVEQQQKQCAAPSAATPSSSSTLPLHIPKHAPLSQTTATALLNAISSPKKKTNVTNSTQRAKNGLLEEELGQRRNYDDALLELLISIET